MIRDELVKYLKEELNYIYCDTCAYDSEKEDDGNCEGCNRKYMNWSISENKCKNIIDTVLKKLEG